MDLQTTNPTTGNPLKAYPLMSDGEVNTAIIAASHASLKWRDTKVPARAVCMTRLADLLQANARQYAQLITEEMGKPLASAQAEVEKCSKVCRYFAENAANFLEPELIKTEMKKSYVTYQPLGVIFAIMPWNFPFWQVFRCAAPNIMAGNAIMLKHAPIVTRCSLKIADLFLEAGFPPYLFSSIIIDEHQAEAVIAHPQIAGVTLTGSVRAGRAVAKEAGKYGKKAVLELGGSDPYVVLEDADLKEAARLSVQSRLANSGQVCIAAKRFIVVEAVKPAFQREVMSLLDQYVMGDPMKAEVTLGPLARSDLREHLHDQVEQSVQQGAKLLRGGKIPAGPGFFYPITVLDDVQKGMTAYEDELFGPVIAFIAAKDEAEAIQIANDTIYGLSAVVFTRDTVRGEKIAANQLIAGACYVNQMVSSDPRLPFGGVKASGFGRELAKIGMHEFMNVKTVGVA